MGLPPIHPDDRIYPSSDGERIGERSLEVSWIFDLFGWFGPLFQPNPDVFVAASLLWYPVQGKPKVVTTPDVMLAFGRPKGDRWNYLPWREGDTPPQVVFEVRQPSSTPRSFAKLFRFYQKYGVEEFYLYGPQTYEMAAWVRDGKKLVAVKEVNGFTSPRLGVRFEVPGTEPMRVIGPDGQPFPTLQELAERIAVRQRIARMSAKLRELGVDPDAV